MTCWFLDLAERVLNGLYAQIQPSLSIFIIGAGYLPDWDIPLMQTAYNLEPALLSPVLLIERLPYTRSGSFLEKMRAAVRRGWLYEENGKFGLTEAGREIIAGMYELSDRLQAKIKALTGPEMERLLYLFDRVIAQIKELPEPAVRPAFELSLLFDRGEEIPLIVQVRQRILILLSFRDDVHVAAWRPCESDGRLWEAFTLVWRGQAGCAAELAKTLPYRNYAVKDYKSALKELTRRGWITVCGGRFTAQEQAARMRQQVEYATDSIFTAAFAGLSPVEMREFQRLMEKLAGGVTRRKECLN